MEMRLHPYLRKLPPGPMRSRRSQRRSLTRGRQNIQLLARLRSNTLGELMKLYDRYGPVFTLEGLGMELVFLVGPEANQYVLVSNSRDFTWGDSLFGELKAFVGRGLLTTDGDVHDRARKLLLPVFYPAMIRSYTDRMVGRTIERVAQLQVGETFPVHEWTRELAVTIAADVLFGMDIDAGTAKRFAELFERGLSFYGRPYFQMLVLRGPATPFQDLVKTGKALDNLIYPEIKRRRRSGAQGNNILDMLIHSEVDGDRLSDQEVRDHAMTLLFAGHDTTSATIGWMFSLIGQNVTVYKRMQEEIERELGGRTPTADDLIDGLPYLDQVIKETLRLYPAAWFGPRRAVKTFELHGHKIPAGTNVAYSAWMTHRLPDLWPNPDAFDPDRFTPEKIKLLQAGAYVPFGRGPRLCIGMRFGELEIKAITTVMMQRFHYELFPGQHFGARTVPTISPKHDVRLTVRAHDSVYNR